MVRLSIVPPDRDYAERVWSQLEPAARPSYFTSWGWIENWLAMIPAADLPPLAVVHADDTIVAAAFVARRRCTHRHLWPTSARFLNVTGVPRWDALCIEHNTLLSTRPWTVGELVSLLPADWDELVLPAIAHERASDAIPAGYASRIERVVPAPYVDLERVRARGYVPLLSSNTRQQIRRARRAAGEHQLEVAGDVDQAMEIFDELVALHTASWTARGKPGAFADPWFVEFHRRLIRSRFTLGEIQLLRVRTARGTLACLYNLIAHGRVLFYQSGLVRDDAPGAKSGFVAHAAAIEHAAEAGHAIYDFLAGDGQYKQSMSTDAVQLAWLRVSRMKPQFIVEDWLRAWRDRWREAT